MRGILIIVLLAGLVGCETWETPWVRGSVTAGLPHLTKKFPPDAAFFVDKTERRVKAAFEKALRARGFEVVEKEELCDVVVKASVDAWEFNDVGFGGRGERDDMELSVALVDRRTKRVLDRARIAVRSDFRVFAKYVEGL